MEMLLENRSMRTQNSCTASGGTYILVMPQTVGLTIHKAPLNFFSGKQEETLHFIPMNIVM